MLDKRPYLFFLINIIDQPESLLEFFGLENEALGYLFVG